MNNIISNKLYIALLHIGMGLLIFNPTMSKALNIGLLFVGFISIIKSNNKNQEAILWAAYVVGSEVLFRMTKGLIFYEFPKYMVFLFLLTGLMVEKKHHQLAHVYIIYLLLLLIGIAFSDIPFPESIRTNIIFNLSGPILLGICALYFYKRKIDIEIVFRMIYFMALPMLSMLTYLYFKTPDIESLQFTANSNYQSAGGFGPNQVSTILSLGMFCFLISLYYKNRITGYQILDFLILLYLAYRALITLSRGGFITAVLAIIAFSFYYFLSKKNTAFLVIKYTLLFIPVVLVLWVYSTKQTDGMLLNRYTNKTTRGEIKADVSTGRMILIEHEFKSFMENPFFGIGVGSGKFKKLEELNIKSATHNEMSRLLGEHGMLGLIILFLLITVPLLNMFNQPFRNRAFLSAFMIFWFLTINHSAMRIAMSAFMYGLSVMIITNKKEFTMLESEEEN